jgi:predicted DNA-binding protein
MSEKINIEFYDSKNLKEKVYNFLKKIDASATKELFNIKYTLRVSQKISQYLNFKSRESSTPKADWLRDQIAKMMEQDSKYKDFEDSKFEIAKE